MFDKLKDVISSTLNCDLEDVKPEAELISDLGADSLDAVELGMAIEDAFGLTIEDEALAKFKTVQDIMRFIEENM